MKTRLFTRLLTTLIVLCLLLLPASAQILLKPNGQNAMPLRMKSIAVDAVVERQFTTTRQTLTFENQADRRIEADFIYTLPPDTQVTYFAYWYGDEKVVARVVEKERAAAIYQHITSRMRDPALIELIGKDTFRARIFPVEPRADLRVEMVMVQTLPSTPHGALYSLPLPRMERGESLDSVSVNVRVRTDGDVTRVLNNFGLPVERESDAFRFAFQGTRYRPQKDVRLSLIRDPRTLQAALYAAPSGGSDGFFALALTADRRIVKPAVRIEGVSTYDVVAERPAVIGAHRSLLVVGRYRGSGSARVTLAGIQGNGKSPTQTVWFGRTPEPNNVASKLWAARRIAVLGRSERNRDAVVALSQRHTLPSKFTSWLAVPKAELERYHAEKAQAELHVTARQLVREIAAGRGRTRAARTLRARLDALCRNPGSPSARSAIQDAVWPKVRETGRRLAHEITERRPHSAEAKRLRRTLDTLAGLLGADADYAYEHAFSNAIRDQARLLAEEIAHERGNSPQARRLRAGLSGLARESDIDYREYVDDYVRLITEGQIMEEFGKTQPDRAWARRLEERYVKASPRDSAGRDRARWLAATAEGQTLDRLLAERPSDKPENPALRARRDAVAQVERDLYLRARRGDPLLQVEAPADARQVVALMPTGEGKPLTFNAASGKWEVRFDIPGHAEEGVYRIRVVIVDRNGMRRTLVLVYRVDMTPPTAIGAIGTSHAAEVRLELEVSADTDRVVALLPWNDKVTLRPLTTDGTRFGATAAVPEEYRGRQYAVTFVVTDRAHNRMAVTVDLGEE